MSAKILADFKPSAVQLESLILALETQLGVTHQPSPLREIYEQHGIEIGTAAQKPAPTPAPEEEKKEESKE